MKILKNTYYGREKGINIFLKNFKYFPVTILEGNSGCGKTTFAFKVIEKQLNEYTTIFLNCNIIKSYDILLEYLILELKKFGLISEKEFINYRVKNENEKNMLLRSIFTREKIIVFIDDFFKIEEFSLGFGKLFLTQNFNSKLILSTKTKVSWFTRYSDKILRLKFTGLKYDPTSLFLNSLIQKNNITITNDDLKKIFKITNGYPLFTKIISGIYILKKQNKITDISSLSETKKYEFLLKIILNELSSNEYELLCWLCTFRRVVKLKLLKKMIFKKNSVLKLLSLNIIDITNENFIFIHSIIKDFILSQLKKTDIIKYHLNCIEYFKKDLKDNPGDQLLIIESLYHYFEINDIKGAAEFFNDNFYYVYKTGLYNEILYYTKIIIEKENDIRSKIHNLIVSAHFKKIDNIIISLKEIENNDLNLKERISLYYALGNFYYDSNNYLNSIKYFKEELILRKFLNHIKETSLCHISIAKVYKKLKQYSNAMYHLNKALFIIKLKDPKITANIYKKIGVIYLKNKKINSSLNYLQRSLKLCKKINSIIDISENFKLIGEIYSKNGFYKKAILNYKKALTYFERSNDHIKVINCLNEIATIYIYSKEFIYAEKNYYRAIKIANRSLEFKLKIYIYSKLMNLYRITLNKEKFYEIYRSALNICNENNYLFSKIIILIEFSLFLFWCEEYDEAFSNIEKCSVLIENTNNREYIEKINLLKALLSSKINGTEPFDIIEKMNYNFNSTKALKAKIIYTIDNNKNNFKELKNNFSLLTWKEQQELSYFFKSDIDKIDSLKKEKALKEKYNIIIDETYQTININKNKNVDLLKRNALFLTISQIALSHPKPIKISKIYEKLYNEKYDNSKYYIISNHIKNLNNIIDPVKIIKTKAGYEFKYVAKIKIISKNSKYSGRHLKILKIIKKHLTVSNKQLREHLNISNATVFRNMQLLLNDNIVEIKGKGRNTCYKLTEKGYNIEI